MLNKRTDYMDRLEDIYKEFCVMMTEDRIYENPEVGFGDICRELGVEPSVLDRLLQDELGYTGAELLEEYRKTGPET